MVQLTMKFKPAARAAGLATVGLLAIAACSPTDVQTWIINHRPPKPPTTTTTGAPPSSTSTTIASTTSSSSPPTSQDTTTTVAPPATTQPPPTTTSTTVESTTTTTAPAASGCGMATPAFCDTFDSAQPGATPRGGDLSPVWGVSRTGGDSNFGQGTAEHWASFPIELCGTTEVVAPPRDVQVCGGQLHEGMDDEHGVKTLAMYPKQPFDFAGRTGVVRFQVSNDTQGSHAAWPEFWMSDQPVPAPFTHLGSFAAVPRNGFGIRFAGCTDGNGVPSQCDPDYATVGVQSAEVVRNYAEDDSEWNGNLRVIGTGSVRKSGPGEMNQYELRISQDRIEVWASDPFVGPSSPPLRQVAFIPDAGLTFTRGLIWLEDSHYNGSKEPGTSQQVHTFRWDDVGFDGPKTYRDFATDVPMRADGSGNTGWNVFPGQTLQLAVEGIHADQTPTAAHVDFQWFTQDVNVPRVSVNGGPYHTVAWPFDSKTFTERTISVPIPLSEIHDGTNTLSFQTDAGATIHDVDLILVAAGAVP